VSGLTIGLVAGALLVGAWPAAAQQPGAQAPTPAQRAQQYQARFQIGVMEGALERAVLHGAQQVRVQVQAIAPELLFINGAARARGFWLDGYGVFFDVDVPAMRRSLLWSFHVLNDGGPGQVDLLVRRLRRDIQNVGDQAVAARLQSTVVQLERAIGPGQAGPRGSRSAAGPVASGSSGNASGATAPGTAEAADDQDLDGPQLTPEQVAILEDPALAYTQAVKHALIEAIVEYSAPIQLAADQWLTVAARDQEGWRVQSSDPNEASTLLLRIRGADLAAYRAGQIDAHEVRTRVEIKEY
jgi:hypothetical protein